jgi:hypothetical protein
MAPGRGRTGGGTEARRNQCLDDSVTGNSSVITRERGAREDLGEKALTCGPRLSAFVEW